MRSTLNALASGATLAALALAAAPCPGAEPTATVIEYYAAALNHYFITADPAEAAMLVA